MSTPIFLRNPPLALDPVQRTLFTALGFALENLNFSYTRMVALAPIAISPADGDTSISTEDSTNAHVAMFGSAWSMIDQIYAINCIGRRLSLSRSNPLVEFMAMSDSANLARNYMDHLSAKIDNLIKAKKQRPPLFGALSFRRVREHHRSDNGNLTGFESFSVLSTISEKQSLAKIYGNSGEEEIIEGEYGFFELQAEDVSVHLSRLFLKSLNIVDHFNSHVANKVETQIRNSCEMAGVDPDETLSKRAGLGFIFKGEVSLDDG